MMSLPCTASGAAMRAVMTAGLAAACVVRMPVPNVSGVREVPMTLPPVIVRVPNVSEKVAASKVPEGWI